MTAPKDDEIRGFNYGREIKWWHEQIVKERAFRDDLQTHLSYWWDKPEIYEGLKSLIAHAEQNIATYYNNIKRLMKGEKFI